MSKSQKSKNLISNTFQMACKHLFELMVYFDPVVKKTHSSYFVTAIKKTSNFQQQHWNLLYFFPFLFILISFLYGNVFLVYLEDGNIRLDTLQGSSASMIHQSMPSAFWPQINAIYGIAIVTVSLNYLTFFTHPYLAGRYEVVEEAKILNKNTKKNIKRKRQQLTVLKICEKSMYEN